MSIHPNLYKLSTKDGLAPKDFEAAEFERQRWRAAFSCAPVRVLDLGNPDMLLIKTDPGNPNKTIEVRGFITRLPFWKNPNFAITDDSYATTIAFVAQVNHALRVGRIRLEFPFPDETFTSHELLEAMRDYPRPYWTQSQRDILERETPDQEAPLNGETRENALK